MARRAVNTDKGAVEKYPSIRWANICGVYPAYARCASFLIYDLRTLHLSIRCAPRLFEQPLIIVIQSLAPAGVSLHGHGSPEEASIRNPISLYRA